MMTAPDRSNARQGRRGPVRHALLAGALVLSVGACGLAVGCAETPTETSPIDTSDEPETLTKALEVHSNGSGLSFVALDMIIVAMSEDPDGTLQALMAQYEKDDMRPLARRTHVWVLGALGERWEARVEAPLQGILDDSGEHPGVRAEAGRQLVSLGLGSPEESLVEMLLTQEGEWEAEYVSPIEVLRRIDQSEQGRPEPQQWPLPELDTVDQALSVLSDDQASLTERYHSAQYLVAAGDEAVPRLKASLSEASTSESVRLHMMCLGYSQCAEAREALESLVDSDDALAQVLAAYWLARRGSHAGLDVATMSLSSEDETVAQVARQTLEILSPAD